MHHGNPPAAYLCIEQKSNISRLFYTFICQAALQKLSIHVLWFLF